MGKKKPPGQYCRVCDRRRANEKFSGKGHAQHICKDCQRELQREARQKCKALEVDKGGAEVGDNQDREPILDDGAETVSAPPRSSGKKGIPYHELDPNIVKLVQALNRYPGVMTIGSCGGHESPSNPSQWPSGTWYVKFNLPSGRFGWYLLEHLAWVVNKITGVQDEM